MSTPPEVPGKSDIIIDLRVSQNANLFADDQEQSLLQKNALDKLSTIIEKLAKKSQKEKSNNRQEDFWTYSRFHDVITLDGVRGSGKTTFILNVLHRISREGWPKEAKCSIESLGIIDPTLIESREHIFLAVIARILYVVERDWERRRAKIDNTDVVDAQYNGWRECLSRLSRGLCNIGSKPAWDEERWADPQFIMEEGLENARQGERLERYFHTFVEQSLRLIDKDAFILALDDIDTHVEAGWPVLEVLRKYLTTPRIIVILSGDIELYTKVILYQQCQQMKVDTDKILGKNEDYKEYRNLVHDLTEQYMLKIMRPDHRIEMQTVAQIDAAKIKVWVTYVSRKQEEPKTEKVKDILEKFCAKIYGSEFKASYLAKVLMEVPTRTCVLMLYTATEFLDSIDSIPPTDEKRIRQLYIEAVRGLGHVFQNALARAGISIKHVDEAEHVATLGPLARTLANHGLLKQGFHLFPSVETAWQRQLVMVLGAAYARVLPKMPAQLFSYLVNMCLTAHLQGMLDETTFKGYIESALEAEFETLTTVKRGIKFLVESKKIPNDHLTRYCTFGLKDNTSLQVISWHRYIMNMSSVFAEHNGSTHRYVSFYTLLGAIATLMWSSVENDQSGESAVDAMQQFGSEESLSSEPTQEDAEEERREESLSPEPTREDHAPPSVRRPQEAFGALFTRWCWSEVDDNKPMPLLALAEAWNRFTFSIEYLDRRYNNNNADGIGTCIQYCIIILLNHLLEYESIVMQYKWKNNLTDGNDVFARFADNITEYRKHKEDNKCRIFNLLFSCPMWMHFFDLNHSNTNLEIIRDAYLSELAVMLPEHYVENNDARATIRTMAICKTKPHSDPNTNLNLFDILNKPEIKVQNQKSSLEKSETVQAPQDQS